MVPLSKRIRFWSSLPPHQPLLAFKPQIVKPLSIQQWSEEYDSSIYWIIQHDQPRQPRWFWKDTVTIPSKPAIEYIPPKLKRSSDIPTLLCAACSPYTKIILPDTYSLSSQEGQSLGIASISTIQLSQQLQQLFTDNITYHINPTGTFVIGGPHGDTGLTGRKIIVDTYGGKGAHGGGAFSGKDPSKVDRSGAYATRHIAKNLVAAGLCKEVLVQVSYAIGVAEPTSINVDTYGTSNVKLTDGEISEVVEGLFDMRPYFIEQRLKLRQPMYSETAAYGHMGRENKVVTKTFTIPNAKSKTMEVELFTWEKLDFVEKVKNAFSL